MSAYCIFDIVEITDVEKMQEYRSKVGATVEQYGGRYIVRGGPFAIVEGDWSISYPVVLEFSNLKNAYRWYNSKEYRELKKLRLIAAKSNGFFVEGI